MKAVAISLILTAFQAPITESFVRKLATEAVSVAPNNIDVTKALFEGKMRAIYPDYRPFIFVTMTGTLNIIVTGPVGLFQAQLMERVRRYESTEGIPWSTQVHVSVTPTRIDSPDIDKIMLVRSGKTHAPVKNLLTLERMKSGAGVEVALHQVLTYLPNRPLSGRIVKA